jgi:hypothetical protein
MTTVAQHIRSIQIRIETIAEKESLPGETGESLDETLAALTEAGRRRVRMLLDRIRAFSEDPNERTAAGHIRRRAARAWYGPSVTLVGDPFRACGRPQ